MVFNARQIAIDILSHCESASGDMSMNETGCYDDCKAEDIYNDQGIMSDLIGDQLAWKGYDRKNNKEQRRLVITELKRYMPHISSRTWEDLMK